MWAEKESERGGGERVKKTIRLKNLLQTPEEPCDWGFSSSSKGSWCISAALGENIPSWPGRNCACTFEQAAMYAGIHPKTVIPLHLLATQKPLPPTVSSQAPLSCLIQPAPQTKAEKLGSCVDDRATNLFGGTHHYEQPVQFSSWKEWIKYGHAEMGVFVKMSAPTMPSGIIHAFHMRQMPGPDSILHLIWHSQFIQGHKRIYYL